MKSSRKMSEDFISKIINGDKRTISRAISIIEDDAEGKNELLKKLYRYTGKAHRIGVTGPPGAGKSTITNFLVKLIVEKGLKVGVIAVDPSSPYTGGALLGDRIRMTEIGIHKNVFIRSMATRGSLGGLCESVVEVSDLLDAAGMDFVIIETVGVGQSELDIAETADTTIVVLVPESGDSIQAMKAGLMEIADIFVLNKADREGADTIAATIKNIIHLKPPAKDGWIINVLKTVGIKNEGIKELFDEIQKHKDHLHESGFLIKKRKDHLNKKIIELVNNRLEINFWDQEKKNDLKDSIEKIYIKKNDPYSYVEEITGKSSIN
jgi:LAO/AO transport system kinase